MSAPSINIESLRHFIEGQLAQWKIPGAAIGIIKDGDILFAEGFGTRKISEDAPVTPETGFAIGSASKAFTATSIALMVQDGLLELDTPVATYMPEFGLSDPDACKCVNMRDLLTHRTGLPRHDASWYGTPLGRRELVEIIKHLDASQSFRTSWQYQNHMYIAAGYAIEKLTGQTWESFVKERLFSPLGMLHSNFSVNDFTEGENVARPHLGIGDDIMAIPYRELDAAGPAGSINSNLHDMLKWLSFNLSKGMDERGIFSSPTLMGELQSPQQVISGPLPWLPFSFKETPHVSYGMGWFVEPYRSHDHVHHGGNIDGFASLVSFLPEEQMGIVILTNKHEANIFNNIITYRIYDLLLGLTPIDWSSRYQEKTEWLAQIIAQQKDAAKLPVVPDTQVSHPLGDYAGIYRNPGYGELTIALQDDKLILKYNAITLPMEHHHYDTFSTHVPMHEITLYATFQTDLTGRIISVEIPFEPTPSINPINFKRI